MAPVFAQEQGPNGTLPIKWKLPEASSRQTLQGKPPGIPPHLVHRATPMNTLPEWTLPVSKNLILRDSLLIHSHIQFRFPPQPAFALQPERKTLLQPQKP